MKEFGPSRGVRSWCPLEFTNGRKPYILPNSPNTFSLKVKNERSPLLKVLLKGWKNHLLATPGKVDLNVMEHTERPLTCPLPNVDLCFGTYGRPTFKHFIGFVHMSNLQRINCNTVQWSFTRLPKSESLNAVIIGDWSLVLTGFEKKKSGWFCRVGGQGDRDG